MSYKSNRSLPQARRRKDRTLLSLLSVFSLSLLLGSSSLQALAYWKLEANQAYHKGGLTLTLVPPLSAEARWKGSAHYLLVADKLDRGKNFEGWLAHRSAPTSWSFRLYSLERKNWRVWRTLFEAKTLLLIQLFETQKGLTLDCLLKNFPEEDRLLRLWFPYKTGRLLSKEIARGRFRRVDVSPALRTEGSGRFLYTLDASGSLRSFDTLRGYCTRETLLPGAKDFRMHFIQEDLSQILLEVDFGSYSECYDGQTFQKR